MKEKKKLPEQLMESAIDRGSKFQTHLTGDGQLKRLGGSIEVVQWITPLSMQWRITANVTKQYWNSLYCDSILDTVNLWFFVVNIDSYRKLNALIPINVIIEMM